MKPDYASLPPPPLSSSSQGDCHVIAKKWHINEAPLRGSFLLMSPHKTIRWFEEGHGGRHLAHLIKQEERESISSIRLTRQEEVCSPFPCRLKLICNSSKGTDLFLYKRQQRSLTSTANAAVSDS